MERAVAMAVGIDRIGETVRAVVEGLGELGAHQSARARHELAQPVGQHIGAEAAGDLLDALHAERRARHQRPHVAHVLLGEARIAEEDLQRPLVGDAGVHQLGRRDDDAFLEDVGGVGADRAGAQAADVGEMRPAHDEAAAPAVVEHRRQQYLVVGMRDGAARAVAVVVPVEVARPHGVGREVAEHRAADVAEHRQVRAHRHDAVGVEQRGVKVLLLADEGGDGGALDQRLHLGLRGPHGTAHDLEGDGIAGARGSLRQALFGLNRAEHWWDP
jgi:hypothetical protein